MTRLPRPNPDVYPRMYTTKGKLLHRTFSRTSTMAMCGRVPVWRFRAVEGRKPAAYLFLIEFVPPHADTLTKCRRCHELTGKFA